MKLIFKLFSIPIFFLAGLSCKENKLVLPGNEDVTVKEWLEFFPNLNLPFTFYDSILTRKETDSAKLSNKAIEKLFNDSLILKNILTKKTISIYAIGKTTDKDKITYLFLKTVQGKSKSIHVLCINEKYKVINSMKLLESLAYEQVTQYCEINKSVNFKIVQEKKLSAGNTHIVESSFFLASDGNFKMAAVNTNEDLSDALPINPIDSLSRKNKFCGDYEMDKKNIISVRDGFSSKNYIVFIHISRNKGACNGEVKFKGEAEGKNQIRISEKSGPCNLILSFIGNNVSITETGACGNYRDLDCAFEGVFKKRKELPSNKIKRK